jgi:hypothetical protein
MRWLLLSPLVAFCLVVAVTPGAVACINDREADTHEREFKSDYLKQPGSPGSMMDESAPAPAADWQLFGASGLGLGLLAGAAVIGVTRPGNRR